MEWERERERKRERVEENWQWEATLCTRSISAIVIDTHVSRSGDASLKLYSIFSWRWVWKESCARICWRDQTADANKLECSWLLACARGLSSTLSRPSIINQRILVSGQRIYCVTCVSDALTRPKLMLSPGNIYVLHCEIFLSDSMQTSRKWYRILNWNSCNPSRLHMDFCNLIKKVHNK